MGLGCALGRRGGRHGVEGQRVLGNSWCCRGWGVCGQRVASGLGRRRGGMEPWRGRVTDSAGRSLQCRKDLLSRQGRQGGAPT